jgi:predicted  nucleic acid-binding Zn-ribbon protein
MGMPEEKKRINAVIDIDLYVKITEAGYGISEAVTKGFEKLLEVPETNTQSTAQMTNDGLVIGLQAQVTTLEEKLAKAPDPVELAEVRAHFEGLQRLTEEKDKRINDLTREVEGLQKQVETLNVFAHYFKSVEIKQIEAPAAEKSKPWWKFW